MQVGQKQACAWVLVLVWVAGCRATPRDVSVVTRAPCYRIKYIPLHRVFMGVPRVAWMDRGWGVSYVFGARSSRVGALLDSVSSKCRLPILETAGVWKYEIRFEIEDGPTRIYITRDSKVVSRDERFVYWVEPAVVNAAVQDILRLAEGVKPCDPSDRTPPGAPFGCLPCDLACWERKKIPHLRVKFDCKMPPRPAKCRPAKLSRQLPTGRLCHHSVSQQCKCASGHDAPNSK